MISITDLHKMYVDGEHEVTVLSGLSINVEAQRSLAVLGPSGSGKSTFLNILAGIVSVDAGSVQFNVRDESFALHLLPEAERTAFRRRHVGYVHQFFNLIPTLTVWENVALPASLNKLSDVRERAEALLDEFGLLDRAGAFPDVLSGGEQQRVAVARAIVTEPAIVLADEPTGNLDRVNTEAVTRLLFATCERYGATLIVATHSPTVAALADEHLYLTGSANDDH